MLSYRRISRHQHCHQLQGAILDPISRHFSDITSESPMFTPPKPKYRGSVQVFSGIQPTGVIHIGNYLGAVANFAIMQDLELIRARQFAAGQLAEGSSNHSTNGGTKSKKPIPPKKPLYCIVDMHSITIHQDPEALRKHSYEMAAVLLACGLDPQHSTIYAQSHVQGHAHLQWLLQCITPVSKLYRMTQFKDKAAKVAANEASTLPPSSPPVEASGSVANSQPDDEEAPHAVSVLPRGVGIGLLTYPVLMAADILLFKGTHIPVGDDQTQHLELARELARTFNTTHCPPRSPLFPEPNPVFNTDATKVMNLRTGTTKMSKSDPSAFSRVNVTDTDDAISKALKRAVSDSHPGITYDPVQRPGVSNLLEIYAAIINLKTKRERCKAAVQASEHGDFSLVKRNDSGLLDLVLPDRVTPQQIASGYSSIVHLKQDLTDVLIEELSPIRAATRAHMANIDHIDHALGKGSDSANELANQTLDAASAAVGFIPRLPRSMI